MTAFSAAVAVVGNTVGLAATVSEGAAAEAPTSRLGAAIAADISERDKAAARRNRALDLREQAAQAAESRLRAATCGWRVSPSPDRPPPPSGSPGRWWRSRKPLPPARQRSRSSPNPGAPRRCG